MTGACMAMRVKYGRSSSRPQRSSWSNVGLTQLHPEFVLLLKLYYAVYVSCWCSVACIDDKTLAGLRLTEREVLARMSIHLQIPLENHRVHGCRPPIE